MLTELVLPLLTASLFWYTILCTCFLFIVIVFFYYLMIFILYKVKLNKECWFCMRSNVVKFFNKNNWFCFHCGQYNGFEKNGSYNKLIKEQYTVKNVRYCRQSPVLRYEQHRLCDECNQSQAVKIKLLAEFVPLDETLYDRELVHFRKHLESQYRLCEECELLINKVIDQPFGKQHFHSAVPTDVIEHNQNDSFVNRLINFKTSCNIRIWTVTWSFFVKFLSVFNLMLILGQIACLSSYKTSFLMHYLGENFSKDQVESCLLGLTLLFVNIHLLLTYHHKTFSHWLNLFELCFCIGMFFIHHRRNHFWLKQHSMLNDQQCIWTILVSLTLVNFTHHCYHIYQCSFSAGDKIHLKTSQPKRMFHFVKHDADTHEIGEQIKELSLSDLGLTDYKNRFNSSFDENTKTIDGIQHDDLYEGFNIRKPKLDQFTIPPPINSFDATDTTYKQSNINFSCIYQLTKSNQSVFGAATCFLSNDTNDSDLTYSCRTSTKVPQTMNYFESKHENSNANNSVNNCQKTFDDKSTLTKESYWLPSVIHTSQATLLLFIFLLIFVILSMPITLSYNVEGNSFHVNIVVHNVTVN